MRDGLELSRSRGGMMAWFASRFDELGASLVHGRRGACDASAGGGQGGSTGTLVVER